MTLFCFIFAPVLVGPIILDIARHGDRFMADVPFERREQHSSNLLWAGFLFALGMVP